MKELHQSALDQAIGLSVTQLIPGTAARTGPTGSVELQALESSRTLRARHLRLADMAALSLALLLSMTPLFPSAGYSFLDLLTLQIPLQALLGGGALLGIWFAAFEVTGLHASDRNASRLELLSRLATSVGLATLPLGAAMLLRHQEYGLAVKVSLLFAGTSLLLIGSNRLLFTFHETVRPALRRKRTLLVVGTGRRARLMTLQMQAHPNYEYELLGFVDSNPQPDCAGMAPLLGSIDALDTLLMRFPVDEVLIALPLKSSFSEVERAVSVCNDVGVRAWYSMDLFHCKYAKSHTLDEVTGMRGVEMVYNDRRLILKELLDRTAALVGIVVLSPVFFAVAAAIKLTSRGPIFFVQERWGRNKRTFGMIKFRSMVVDAEARIAALEQHNEFDGPMFKMKNDPRVTRLGRYLRRTSMDELPQLFNVLMGDMSLVGPRPLASRDVALFSKPWLMRRFSVKPGITGLWQVSGRSETSFDQSIRLDLEYIDRWSLRKDFQILVRTIAVVLRGQGAY